MNRRQVALPTSSNPSNANRSRPHANGGGDGDEPPSSEPINPSSSAAGSNADFSARSLPSDVNDEGNGVEKVIWGTNIVIDQTMRTFTAFLLEFKPKYRREYDRRHGALSTAGGTGASRYAAPLIDGEHGNQSDNTELYVHYLRLMRLTNQSNLNLDTTNLLAYPPTRKLYYQLCNYPAEVIPVMDQVLRDTMFDVAMRDREHGVEGMEGDLGEEELRAIETTTYKVRPFGAEKMVNMRDLNPNGKREARLLFSAIYLDEDRTDFRDSWKFPDRYRQARLHQRSRYSSDSRHPRYESWCVFRYLVLSPIETGTCPDVRVLMPIL